MGILSRLLRRPPAITPAKAAAALAAGQLRLVDVREPGEWAGGVAAGAELMSLGDVRAALPDLAGSHVPVAFVCHSGARSSRAAALAATAGVDIRNVTGGMTAWTNAQLPTHSPQRP